MIQKDNVDFSENQELYLLRMNVRKLMRWSFFLWQGNRVQRYVIPAKAGTEEKETSRTSNPRQGKIECQRLP